MSVCHGGNSDDLVSISAMTGTVAVNFCVYFNGLYKEERIKGKIYEAFVMITQLSFISFISNGKHFHAQDLCAKC